MSLPKKLLIFHLIITLGYSITGLAAFFSIEISFHKISYLGLALCLRTFSACIIGYMANILIKKFGIRKLFLGMITSWIAALICMFYAFDLSNFLFVIVGIILIGVVAALNTILLTIAFRLISENNISYRKNSGSRELFFGFARLIACLITPPLLLAFDTKMIFLINAIICLTSISFFINLNVMQLEQVKTPEKNKAIKVHYLFLKSRDTWTYMCQIGSSWMLIALIPLLSSSNQIGFVNELPIALKQSLWSIEAGMMIFSSMLYLLSRRLCASEIAKAVLMLNSLFLFPLLFFLNSIMVLIIAAVISASIMVSFYIFRDDYIIAAGKNRELIDAHSALSSVIRDLMCSISPIILSMAFNNLKLHIMIFVILMLQFSLYIGHLLIAKNRTHFIQSDII